MWSRELKSRFPVSSMGKVSPYKWGSTAYESDEWIRTGRGLAARQMHQNSGSNRMTLKKRDRNAGRGAVAIVDVVRDSRTTLNQKFAVTQIQSFQVRVMSAFEILREWDLTVLETIRYIKSMIQVPLNRVVIPSAWTLNNGHLIYKCRSIIYWKQKLQCFVKQQKWKIEIVMHNSI